MLFQHALALLGALCVLVSVPYVRAGVSMSAGNRLTSEELGLYNVSDKVVILMETNFNATVLDRNHSSLVEFYNSFCGHCKRFAPKYKELAQRLLPWHDVLYVSAIDCNNPINTGVCRDYEIMGYPTLRYMGPGFQPSNENYGRPVETQNITEIRTILAQWLAEEKPSAELSPNWPNFRHLDEQEAQNVFARLPPQKQYVAIVYEPENSTLGIETILNFRRYETLEVRRIGNLELAQKQFQIDGKHKKLALVKPNYAVESYSTLTDTAEDYNATLASVLKSHNVKPSKLPEENLQNVTAEPAESEKEREQRQRLLKHVRDNKHLVYQADLEMAIRGALFNEIPKQAQISGERLVALRQFMGVLQRYNPLSLNGQAFVAGLHGFVMHHNEKLNGKDFEKEAQRLEDQYKPVFSSSRYVGCSASKPKLRGFTCSLWQLFHYMTVQAANNAYSEDPQEVLQAMYGYVKYFFGCTDCSEHFQSMAASRSIWSVPTKEDAVLWLWATHNQVNDRLRSDATEDPMFPKINFPSKDSCSECYRSYPVTISASTDIDWNKNAVLSFLKNIHNPKYISRFGVDNEQLLHQPELEKYRQKRMTGNIFTDMDMSMGIFLYGFCVVMLVGAFKLFALKGYRRKPYAHDYLGKA